MSLRTACATTASLTLIAAASAAAQDTVVVRADNAPVWGEHPQLVEEVRIGMLDGPDEYLFGSIGAVAVGHDGTIFVYDGQVPVIRQYDPSGTYVKDVGRDGAGPGEYRVVLGMDVLHSGELAIWDPRNMRITVFDAAGRYVDDHRVNTGGLFAANVFAVDTAGNFYVKAMDWSRREGQVARQVAPGAVSVTGGPRAFLFIKVSPSGDVVDSIPLPVEQSGRAFVLATPEGYRGPFVEEPCHTWSPHGYLIVGYNSRYAFDLLLPSSPVRRIERSYALVKVNGGERSQWEAWADFFAQRPGAERYGPIPDEKPAYRALSADEEGRIWVNRYVAATERDLPTRPSDDGRPQYIWREPPTFDVITPEGVFLGSVVLPPNTSLSVQRGTQVWGVQQGESGEDYVVRFRIVPGRP